MGKKKNGGAKDIPAPKPKDRLDKSLEKTIAETTPSGEIAAKAGNGKDGPPRCTVSLTSVLSESCSSFLDSKQRKPRSECTSTGELIQPLFFEAQSHKLKMIWTSSSFITSASSA